MPSWKIPDVRPPEPGHAIRITVDGKPVAVFRVGADLLAIDARCTHVGGPLDRGQVSGSAVTCPLHGSQFDLTNGRVLRGPATQPVRSYRVKLEPDGLLLESD
jgi:nitrite reductase/ring-hydroxylating ferredoxin subunit